MTSPSPHSQASSGGDSDAVIFVRDLPLSIRELIDDPPFRKEIDAFAHMPKAQLDALNGRYIAVYEGRIVDSDLDEADLAERFYDRYGPVPVYIHKVGTEDDLVATALGS